MKVYLAAPWVCKVEATAVKRWLQGRGINVISTWTEQPDDAQNDSDERHVRYACSDWCELRNADVLVLLALAKSEGKATEFGGALMAGKRTIVVSDTRAGNIFYHLPCVELVSSVAMAADLLLGVKQ